jgi:hypothetical protein
VVVSEAVYNCLPSPGKTRIAIIILFAEFIPDFLYRVIKEAECAENPIKE